MNKKIKLLKDTMTVDIGLHLAGAYWDGDPFPAVMSWNNPHDDLKDRLNAACEEFGDWLDRWRPGRVILEGVEVFDSLKSSAAAKRGDTIWLAYLCGALFNAAYERGALDCDIVTARQWKGQLGKKGTILRVQRINGKLYDTDHITDAVAMGFAQVPNVWKLKTKVIG